MEQTSLLSSITNSSNNLQITGETVMGRYELHLRLSFFFLATGVTIPAQKHQELTHYDIISGTVFQNGVTD